MSLTLNGNCRSTAVAETIANNVRSTILKDRLSDPALYERMSALLAEVIADLREKRIDYQEYLRRIAALAKQVHAGHADDTPERLNTPALRALYNSLGQQEELAVRVHETVLQVRPDDWRGHQARENAIKAALLPVLGGDKAEVERIFPVIRAQREY